MNSLNPIFSNATYGLGNNEAQAEFSSPTKEHESIFNESAEKVRKFFEDSIAACFKTYVRLPPTDFLGERFNQGRYGAIHSCATLEDSDGKALVAKLSRTPGSYSDKLPSVANGHALFSKKLLCNEATLLHYIHSCSDNGKPFWGIQLPPKLFISCQGNTPEEVQLGYIGVRYDTDLFCEILSPDPLNPQASYRKKDFAERKFCDHNLAYQLIQGLKTLDELDIIHGDIKTENILILQTASGARVDLADFGSAKTKKSFQENWNAARPNVQKLLADRAFEQLTAGEPESIEDVDKKIFNQYLFLTGGFTRIYAPEEMLKNELSLLKEGSLESSEKCFKAIKRRDLYALALTLRYMLAVMPKFQPSEQKAEKQQDTHDETARLQQEQALRDAMDYRKFPDYTIAFFAKQWESIAQQSKLASVASGSS